MQKRLNNFFKKHLVDSIFKILPLFEESNDGYQSYVDSLIKETSGLVKYLKLDNAEILSLIGVLISLKDALQEGYSHSEVRREVFKAIGLSKTIAEAVI